MCRVQLGDLLSSSCQNYLKSAEWYHKAWQIANKETFHPHFELILKETICLLAAGVSKSV